MTEGKTATGQILIPADFALTEADIQFVLDLAARAGDIAVAMRASATVEEKTSATDLVTSADKALSELIVTELSARFPDDVVLSEEAPWHSSNDGKRRWIVDPIDGTTNFSKGNPYYCISVCAGSLSNQGHFSPIIGCILQPATGDLYAAMPGMGATCNDETMGPASAARLCSEMPESRGTRRSARR
jgi:myo-inositol-1(or 4)-monophosphatase